MAERAQQTARAVEQQTCARAVALDDLLYDGGSVIALHSLVRFLVFGGAVRDGVAVAGLESQLFAAMRLDDDGESVRRAGIFLRHAQPQLERTLVDKLLVVERGEHVRRRNKKVGVGREPLPLAAEDVQRRRADGEKHRLFVFFDECEQTLGIFRVLRRPFDRAAFGDIV